MAAASTWRVMVQFTANNLTGAGFSSLINSINQAHVGTKNLNAALSALQVAGGSALVGFGQAALGVFNNMIDKAGDFQMKMVMIQQSMGDPAKMGYDKFNLSLESLARQRLELMIGKNPTLFGIDQLADIQRQLLQSGFSADQITRTGRNGDSLGQAVAYEAEKEQLRGLATSPQQTALNLAQFLKAYGLSGDAAYNAINTFAKAQSVTGHFSSQDLRYSEQYFGTLARTINMKPEDMIMLTGFFSRMGATSTSGATALNNLFLQSLDPTKGASNFESNRRFQAAMGLGILGHVNPTEARNQLINNFKQMQALGLPSDLSQMTAAQQEKLARSALVETMPNEMVAAYRRNGLQGMSDFFDSSRARLEKEWGKQAGDDKMAVYLAQLLNLRGARGGFVVSAQDLTDDQRRTLGGSSAIMHYVKQVTGQQDIDVLIAQARNTLHGQEATSQNRFNAILLQLGGVDMVTGKALAGGPMDTVLKLLKGLNNIMGEIIKFNAAHPGAASAMGMVVGGVGILATIVGTVLTGLGALGLIRAGLGPGGAAVLGAAGARIGSRLGAFGPGAVPGIKALFQGWGMANVLRPTAGYFPLGPFQGQAFGRGIGGMVGRLGGGSVGIILGQISSHMGIFFDILKVGLPRLLGFVGWISLAIDALSWFSHHPKDIGTFVGEILKLFRDVLIPQGKNLFMMFINWIIDELKKLWEYVQFLTNPGKMIDWGKNFWDSMNKVLNAKPDGPTSPHKQGPKGHPQHGNGHQVALNLTVQYNGNANPADAKKHAALLAKHTVNMLKDSLYSTVGGNGVPGRPQTLVGTV